MSTEIDPDDFEWLVESRSKIQRFLFEIYSFAKGRISGDPSQALQFQMLMAVGFALWRAAFLAHGERSWQKIYEDAIKFLEKLIRDNTVGYVQDRESKGWTFGYYVNDAYFRLAYFHEKLHKLRQSHAQRIAAFLDKQSTNSENEPNSHVAWDHAYEAALGAFKDVSASK